MGAAVSARTVNGMLAQLERCRSVRKSDLRHGDCVVVTTENSVYSICVLEDMTYAIRGGWFDRNGLSPVKTSISGCTWGGSAIKGDIVAACGNGSLRLLRVQLAGRPAMAAGAFLRGHPVPAGTRLG